MVDAPWNPSFFKRSRNRLLKRQTMENGHTQTTKRLDWRRSKHRRRQEGSALFNSQHRGQQRKTLETVQGNTKPERKTGRNEREKTARL